MELIDKNYLINYLFSICDESHDIAEEIANFPTVDAVPVIRCKDCIRYTNKGWCNAFDIKLNDDNYCSLAVRSIKSLETCLTCKHRERGVEYASYPPVYHCKEGDVFVRLKDTCPKWEVYKYTDGEMNERK